MPAAFTALTDLAARTLGGSVVAANDELFAERQNLIQPTRPRFDPHEFGHNGKVYDGWETRRRRDDGHDWAIVALGAPGIVHGVVVDTTHFTGNYPPFVSVDALSTSGHPSVAELCAAQWHSIVPKSAAQGHTVNEYAVTDRRRWTHLRLSIHPDGGVARLRVHGHVIADPLYLDGTIDLLAAENGGSVVDCSNAFYSSPSNLIQPGRARHMGEGWENARRRNGGNDYVVFELAGAGHPRYVEIDTSHYVGNAPGQVSISGAHSADTRLDDVQAWQELLPRTAVQPDTRHRFLLAATGAFTHLRLDVHPDGGLSRLRLFGELDASAAHELRLRWLKSTPAA